MGSTDNRQAVAAALKEKVGKRLGSTHWKTIDQFEEDLFATLIGDFDPMHNETGWGEDVGLGGSVVLGVHVLSLLPSFLMEQGLPARSDEAVTWRPLKLGRVRIPTSLPVGARFRTHTDILDVADDKVGSITLTTAHEIEVEGSPEPFLVVKEFVSLFEFRE